MSANRKRSKMQIYRTIVQIIFFLLLPGLYASTFLGIKTLYFGIINGNLDISANIPSLLEIIAIFPITIFLGRFFCGWMCAFGALGDWLYYLSKKIFKIRFRMPQKADRFLKSIKYIYLVVLVAVIWRMDWSFLSGANPWDAFGYIFTIKGLPDIPGAFNYFMFGTILLIIIMVASMFVERFFCRYLCPLGALFSLSSRFRILKIKKVRKKCGACRICTNNCPMGIPMYEYDKISSGECIQCLRCTAVCPAKNTGLSIAGEKVNTLVAASLAVVGISSVYYTGNVLASDAASSYITYPGLTQAKSTDQNHKKTAMAANQKTGKYANGTFEGTGAGFHGGTTKVSVVVKNGNISDIQVISYQDDKAYFDKAKSQLISGIIEKQSTDVDAVSGATYSSRGIMDAVRNAITGVASAVITDPMDADIAQIQQAGTEGSVGTATDATLLKQNNSDLQMSVNSGTGSLNQSSQMNSASGQPVGNAQISQVVENAPVQQAAEPAPQPAPAVETQPAPQPAPAAETQPAPVVPQPAPAAPLSKYVDGKYQGSGTGFQNAVTTISVTISGGIISNISVISQGDTPKYFTKAYSTVSAQIISAQSASVDAVSGATYSSHGIMSAVQNALNSALR